MGPGVRLFEQENDKTGTATDVERLGGTCFVILGDCVEWEVVQLRKRVIASRYIHVFFAYLFYILKGLVSTTG